MMLTFWQRVLLGQIDILRTASTADIVHAGSLRFLDVGIFQLLSKRVQADANFPSLKLSNTLRSTARAIASWC